MSRDDRGLITVASSGGSLGIHRYGANLVSALSAAGVPATLTERPRTRHRLHAQLGNSTRGVLPFVMAAQRPAVVTIHDAIPRDERLRAPWRRLAPHLLRGHRLIAHSRYTAELLHELGLRGEAQVIPLPGHEERISDERRAAVRADLAPGGQPIALCAGVLKRAKGVLDVLAEAPHHPDVVFAFAGRPDDDETRAALAGAPPNVVLRSNLDDAAFRDTLAAADVLFTLRSDWVGEASDPVARAHAVGTPVVGYDLGGLGEYCGAEDLLVEPGTSPHETIDAVVQRLANGWPRLPLGAPQVTSWADSGAAHRALYTELGWVAPGVGTAPSAEERTS